MPLLTDPIPIGPPPQQPQRSAGEILLDAHQQKVLARMRMLSARAREWQERHDQQLRANEQLRQELEALKVRYELEVSRRKALESELDRAILLAASSAASTPSNNNQQQHKLQGTPNTRWATQRSTNDSCCNNSSSSNVNRAAAGEPGTVQSPYATCSCGKTVTLPTPLQNQDGRSNALEKAVVKRREGEDEEEDKQEEAPMGEGDAAAQHPDSPETDDLPTSPAAASVDEAAASVMTRSVEEASQEGEEREGEARPPLIERLVVVGLSDEKLLQTLNRRREREREREKARAAAAWEEAAERDRKAAALGRRRRKWSGGGRRSSGEGSRRGSKDSSLGRASLEEDAATAQLEGLDEEDEEELHPEVLAAFPANEEEAPLPHGLAEFCLPTGIQVKEVSAAASMSDVYQTLFGSGNIGRHKGCFVFALLRDEKEGLNVDMSPLWGVCIIHPGVRRFYIQSDGSLSTFQDLGLTGGVMSPAEGGGAAAPSYIDVVVPRSYCMLTRCPFFAQHYRVLSGMLEADRLLKVYEMASAGAQDSSLCRGINMDLVERVARDYSSLPWPAPFGGGPVRLDLLDDDGILLLDPIDLSLPSGYNGYNTIEGPAAAIDTRASVSSWSSCVNEVEEDGRRLKALVEWNLPLLLQRVPLKTLTQTIGLLLCEMQVVVVCEDLALLSACTLGLSLLLRPLRWVGTLVPVLPAKYDALLEAPVPFLVGLPAMTEALHSRKGLAILDLNNGALRVHAADALDGRLDPSLLLPGIQGLNDALKEEKAQLAAQSANVAGLVSQRQDYEVKPAQLESARRSQALVHSHVESIVSMARHYTLPPPEATPFLDRFRKTQLWSVHVEGLAVLDE